MAAKRRHCRWISSSDRLFFQYESGVSIHLCEKNIAGPTERSEDANASSKLAEEDLRFSMKMVFAPDSGTT
jgi:hypothetical protein